MNPNKRMNHCNLVLLANTKKIKFKKIPTVVSCTYTPQKSFDFNHKLPRVCGKQESQQWQLQRLNVNIMANMEQQMKQLEFLQNKLANKGKLTAKQKKSLVILLEVKKKYDALKQQKIPEKVDLSDEKAPQGPVWKPVGIVNEHKPIIKPSTLGKNFQQFKAKLEGKFVDLTKDEHQMNSAMKQNTKPIDQIWDLEPETSSQSEIRWEPNPLDEKDGTKKDGAFAIEEKDKPKEHEVPAVAVKGLASQLKLSVLNKKPVVVATTVIPQNKPQINASNNQKILVALKSVPVQKKMPAPFSKPMPMPTMSQIGRPSGVPRSFLAKQQNVSAIEPQTGTQRPIIPRQPINQWAINQKVHPELNIQTDMKTDVPQQYSPSDAYNNIDGIPLEHDGKSENSHDDMSGHKRQSAFDRLGPLSQPKKPKLTINLKYNKDQSVREVVDETEIEDKYTPVHLRADMADSSDEVVMKYLPLWPWKRAQSLRKTVTARTSKSVMLMEQEQMVEIYEKDSDFIQVSIRGFPDTWRKERVMDVVLARLKGKSFMPCFIEFTPQECKFLVIRCLPALLMIHKLGFVIREEEVELRISLSHMQMSLKQIDFIPRLVLRKLLARDYDGERKLSLSEFTAKSDISHFLYFPLHRLTNQTELVQMQSAIAWDYLTDLDLSHNRLTTIDGFDLPTVALRLKHLNLSFNCLERITALLPCRNMALRSLKLEGNPLCHDYIDPDYYVKVLKMIFPCLVEIDGVTIPYRGELPTSKKNYCPPEAKYLVEKFLEIYYPILDSPLVEDRMRIEELYDEKAIMTVTYMHKIRHSHLYRYYRNLFLRARVLEDGELDSVVGAPSITKLICKWPLMGHDPHTFTIDVLHHGDFSTILRIGGIFKLTSETLAEDEHLMGFSRTLVLTSKNGVEYKVQNEMLHWAEPSRASADMAFQINSVVGSKRLSLKLDSAPDEYTKEKLTDIFMKITELDKKRSENCLDIKEWNLKLALEHFMKLIKLDDLNSLGNLE